MSPLPNFADAELDLAKLRDYCLSPAHPWGKHKARVFAAALGLQAQDAAWLRSAILAALPTQEAQPDASDHFGQRWCVDLMLNHRNRKAMIRTIWLIQHDQKHPRFVTAFVL